MKQKTVKKKKIREDFTQEAYKGIRRMFFLNEIVPGQKISYRDLAERLGMSSTPIIQALKRLEFQGLVRHERNCGYYTEKISFEEITEIYEFRKLIEVSLLPVSIEKMNKRKLAKLKKALDSHLNAVRDIYLKDRLLKDMEFHLTLAEFSENSIQIKTLKHLFDLLYLKFRGNIIFVTPMDTVDEAHVRIYEFVSAGDSEKACQVLGEHISNVKNHALLCIKQMIKENSSQVI